MGFGIFHAEFPLIYAGITKQVGFRILLGLDL